ncbi:MAG: Mrp/NBP35 family ATP-binding protein [Candidatus Zipacnadales bacterium]
MTTRTREGDEQAVVSQAEREQIYREQEQRLHERAALIKHTILILSGKGGVGKSTIAVNVAYAWAEEGLCVGVLDADLHGPTIPLMTRLVGQHVEGGATGILPARVGNNLYVMSMGLLLPDCNSPIIWRGPIRANVIRQFIADVEWPALDCLVVDLPPGTGDEPLTVAQALSQASGAVIVTTPQEASLADCRKAIRFVEAVHLPVLGVIENMSGLLCPHCGKMIEVFSTGGGERMATEMKVPFLGRIPLAPEIVSASEAGRPAFGNDMPETVNAALRKLVRTLWERVTA